MPNFKRLSLDLTKVDDWVIEDNKNSAIQPYYVQKDNPPRVGWTTNTVSTVEGSRSVNLFDRDTLFRFPPNNNNLSNLYQIDSLIDIDGNISYLFIDGSLDIGSTVELYTLSASMNYRTILASPITQATFLHQRHTVFQNRTIFMYTNVDDVPEFTNVGNAGFVNAFLEVDLINNNVTFNKVTGTSLSQADKNGITSWGNYVILWDTTTIYWSDPNVFTEFTVGGSSLAGSQSISEGRGNIITIVPNSQGFTIYLQGNIVQASYSGDASNPWIFTEVTGSGGLLLLDGQPLVTRSENTPYQVAYTTKGLQSVGTQEASSLPERISDFVLRNYIEKKDIGTSTITRFDLSPSDVKRPTVKQLFLYDNYLFLIIGSSEEYIQSGYGSRDLGRLYVFDMNTGKMGMHDGDFVSVVPELELVSFSGGDDLQNRNRIYANSFVVTRRILISEGEQALRNNVFDFSNHSNNPVSQDAWTPREAELFVGNITVDSKSNTELLAVTLVGETSIVPQVDGGDEATRARVFVYSEFLPADKPKEFIYNAKLDKYLGFVVGNELQVEVRGQYFYLTDILLDVQKGGEL